MSFPEIRLSIPTVPVAKARPRIGKFGAYTPQKTKSFEAEIRWHWNLSKNQMVPVEPTSLFIICYIHAPKKIKNKFPCTRPDVDNFAKSIADALNGFAWKDDSQITTLIVKKRYAKSSPSIELIIFPDID